MRILLKGSIEDTSLDTWRRMQQVNADSVLFLASDESRAINGVELRVDSGQFVMSI